MTAHTTGFYRHPDKAVRRKQEQTRTEARAAVAAGSIRWGRIEGRSSKGFRYATSSQPIEQRRGLVFLIALYELRDAGRITVDIRTGVVRVAERTS